MEKPTSVSDKNNPLGLNLGLEGQEAVKYNKSIQLDTVSMVCTIDATVKVTGTVTGTQYVFRGAGAVVQVNAKDKDELLNKKRGNSCCGGQSGKSIFALV